MTILTENMTQTIIFGYTNIAVSFIFKIFIFLIFLTDACMSLKTQLLDASIHKRADTTLMSGLYFQHILFPFCIYVCDLILNHKK